MSSPTGFIPYDTLSVKYVTSIPSTPNPDFVYMLWDGVDASKAVRYEFSGGELQSDGVVETTLENLGSVVGQTVKIITDYGVTIAVSDGKNALPTSPARFRFKKKPAPAEYIGMAIITDIGDPYSVWFSDGMNWKPYAGSLVIEQAHQTGNAMTGSGAGGTSDLGFGTSSTYSVFPLGKQFDLLSNIIGNHGSIRVKAKFTATNNANTHEVGLGYGLKYTSAAFIAQNSGSAWDTKILDITMSNRGSETSKTITVKTTTINAGTATDSTTSSTSSMDTSIDQKLWLYGCLRGNSADTIALESFSVELLRA